MKTIVYSASEKGRQVGGPVLQAKGCGGKRSLWSKFSLKRSIADDVHSRHIPMPQGRFGNCLCQGAAGAAHSGPGGAVPPSFLPFSMAKRAEESAAPEERSGTERARRKTPERDFRTDVHDANKKGCGIMPQPLSCRTGAEGGTRTRTAIATTPSR